MKVVFATPTRVKPCPAFIAAMEASVPVLDAAGIEHSLVAETGCPYISHARATMTRKALDAGADCIVYLDDDMSWEPDALLKLLLVKDDVVAGTYRYRKDEEEYMGAIFTDAKGYPVVRADGCMRADRVPAGFLKITRDGLRKFMRAWPELLYGHADCYSVDLFNHGAHEGVWYGEDMSFSRRYRERCGDIWLVPDLTLTHHAHFDDTAYAGNFHLFMRRQSGGDLHEATT